MLSDAMRLVQSEIYAPDVTSAREALVTLQTQCDELSEYTDVCKISIVHLCVFIGKCFVFV